MFSALQRRTQGSGLGHSPDLREAIQSLFWRSGIKWISADGCVTVAHTPIAFCTPRLPVSLWLAETGSPKLSINLCRLTDQQTKVARNMPDSKEHKLHIKLYTHWSYKCTRQTLYNLPSVLKTNLNYSSFNPEYINKPLNCEYYFTVVWLLLNCGPSRFIHHIYHGNLFFLGLNLGNKWM